MISKMGLEMNLRIIKKNNEADPEIGSLTKSIWKPFGDGHAASVEVKKYVLIAKKPLLNIIFTEFDTSGQTVFF